MRTIVAGLMCWIAGCSSGSGGLVPAPVNADAGPDAAPDGPEWDGSSGLDAGVIPPPTPLDVCAQLPAPSIQPTSTECLAAMPSGPCNNGCPTYPVLYFCGGGQPADAGRCIEVDAASLTPSGATAYCCTSATCVRYANGDGYCQSLNMGVTREWSCPPGGSPPAAGCVGDGSGGFCCP